MPPPCMRTLDSISSVKIPDFTILHPHEVFTASSESSSRRHVATRSLDTITLHYGNHDSYENERWQQIYTIRQRFCCITNFAARLRSTRAGIERTCWRFNYISSWPEDKDLPISVRPPILRTGRISAWTEEMERVWFRRL
ncbi:MAG: hypothetical protein Q9198_000376 [Flavoplaca austrocitrina]